MKKRFKQMMAALLAAAMTVTSVPVMSVSAASPQEHIDLSRQAAAEGMVLMENHVINEETGQKSLPLAQGETVAMFGRAMIDYVRGGGGSGRTNVDYERNILQGMQVKEEEGKVTLVPELVDFYTEQVTTNGITDDANITITDEVWNAAAAATETAVVTIGRYSKEGADRSASKGDYYLSDAEVDLLTKVAAEFENTIVVLNVGAVLDTSWAKGDTAIPGIDSVLNAWQAGMEGGLATADILVGDVNPSGKLVDTWAKSYSDYPSSATFKENSGFVNYEEDIYVGYRYFETIPGASEKVNYEFGYGLSYTEFTTEIVKVEVVGDEIVTTAKVTNIGDVAGRQVVQVYFGAPRGDLGKPAKELAAFDKTDLLQPGQSEELVMSFAITDMSSYDDTGIIQESAYVMEAGDYNIYVGNSIKDAGERGSQFVYTLAEDLVAEQLTELVAPTQLTRRLQEDGTYVDVDRAEIFNPHHTVAAEGTTRIEMENFLEASSTLVVENYYDSMMQVNKCLACIKNADEYVVYELTAEAAGLYKVVLSQANGRADIADCFKVDVDGSVQSGIQFNAVQTGDGDGADEWYNFVEADPIYINLKEGVNLVRFTAKRTNPNYDYMLLEKVGDYEESYTRKVSASEVTKIEAESYDASGFGDGYEDYRPRVESVPDSDVKCVGYVTRPGNFVQYFMNVEEAGTYELTMHAANGRAEFVFDPAIYVNGEANHAWVTAPQTGDGDGAKEWYNFADLEPIQIQLPEGDCVLQFTCILKNKFPNLDYFTLEKVGEAVDRYDSVVDTNRITKIEAEDYDTAGWAEGGLPIRTEQFDIGNGTEECLAYMNYPESYVQYYIDVKREAQYDITFVAANGRDPYEFDPCIAIDDTVYPAAITAIKTAVDGNKWYNFQPLDPVSITLTPGRHVLTLTGLEQDKYPNLDYILIEKTGGFVYDTKVSAAGTTKIEAETFDASSCTAGNEKYLPRTEKDPNSATVGVAYMNYRGNLVQYHLNVEEAGTYELIMSTANGRADFDFAPGIYVDGNAYHTWITARQTGDGSGNKEWYNYEEMQPISIVLPEGNCVLQFTCTVKDKYPNMDYFTLRRTGDAPDEYDNIVNGSEVTKIEGEDYDGAGWPVGGTPVMTEIFDIGNGAQECLAFMNYAGNYAQYKITVEEAGDYEIVLCAANGRAAFDFDVALSVDDTEYSNVITMPATALTDNKWYNFVEIDPITVPLTEGQHTLTFTCKVANAYPNFEYILIQKAKEEAVQTADAGTYKAAIPNAFVSTMAVSSSASKAAGKIMLLDVYYNRDLMDTFLDQISDEQLIAMLGGQPSRDKGNTGGMGNLAEFGIPNIMTADGPQGIRIGVNCTAWPISTLLACSWDVELLEKVGQAAAIEAHNNNMDIWLAPGMNIHRDPLCGRNFEYYSEDPYLAGKLAAAITKGCQGEGVAISLKHFAANNKESNRKSSDSRVSERALREIYLKGFEIAVKEADPWTIMTSYNLINGIEASENKELLMGIARGEWGFDGLFESDWNDNASHPRGLLAGNDIQMPTGDPDILADALAKGVITRDDLETSVERLMNLIMKVNYFHDRIVDAPSVEIGADTRFKAADNIILSETLKPEATSDTDGGNNLGYCDAGAWAQYNINVKEAGEYELTARCSSKETGGSFDVIVGGKVAAHFDAPKTGAWQTWVTLEPQTITLEAGVQTMFIEFTESGANLNWLHFTKVEDEEFAIVTQPADTAAAKGADASVFVEATGKGLTYEWYYKNPGNVKFYASGAEFVSEDGAAYTIPMYAWRDGQEVYCVITDETGATLQSNTVTLTMDTGTIRIVEQPEDVVVDVLGNDGVVTVEATGEGLTYEWYYKNPGNVKFYLSGDDFVSEDGAAYTIPVAAWRDGQQVYCVITDANGNSVQTNTVTLSVAK